MLLDVKKLFYVEIGMVKSIIYFFGYVLFHSINTFYRINLLNQPNLNNRDNRVIIQYKKMNNHSKNKTKEFHEEWHIKYFNERKWVKTVKNKI